MHFAAFLLFWLPLAPDAPPETPPRAAFIQKFDTYKECVDYRDRITSPEIKSKTSCMLMVVEPKIGIAE